MVFFKKATNEGNIRGLPAPERSATGKHITDHGHLVFKGWCGLVETAFIEPGTGMSPGAPEVIRSVLFYFRSMIYGY
ncbi:hypothetical protein, partial [Roseibium sediminicola]